jgi:hypothetical protein
MGVETFTARAFRADSLQIIETANAICREYRGQGFDLTLRQVYYQFVARGLLGNNDRNYKRLGSIINDARLAGLMDWSFIQDRTRNVRGSFYGFTDPGAFIENVADGYYEAIWRGQQYRPEVWVEKDALVDIVGQACEPTRTPHFSCRGYVSQSEMYDAAKRIERRRRQGHTPIVIHLGDHDPSGLDMTRDIRERLELMSWGSVEVRRIALNMDQIERYQPPPNPAKITDSRGLAYVDQYGPESWELDALEPSVLTGLIRATVEEYVDRTEMDQRIEHERQQAERLGVIADRWSDLEDNWSDVLDVIGH